jgi:hypothetical protein
MFSPGGSSPYTSTHNTNGHIIYIKVTIQNKLYTITKQNTYSKYKYTHYKNIHTLTKTFTPYKNTPTQYKETHTHYKNTHTLNNLNTLEYPQYKVRPKYMILLSPKNLISKHTKLKVYTTAIKPVVLCGCGTWAMTEQMKSYLKT